MVNEYFLNKKHDHYYNAGPVKNAESECNEKSENTIWHSPPPHQNKNK